MNFVGTNSAMSKIFKPTFFTMPQYVIHCPGGIQYQVQHLTMNGVLGLAQTFQPSPIDTDPWKEAVDRPWPLVEAVSDLIELFLAGEHQVSALRPVRSEEPVGVLAGPALPRAMGVAAGDLDPGRGSQFGMSRPLLPQVIGQGGAQRCGDAVELTRIARQGGGRGGIVPLRQQHPARAALDQDPDRRTVTGLCEEVTLPVTLPGAAVCHRRRKPMNAQPLSPLPAAIHAARARQTGLTPTGDPCWAQRPSRQRVDAGVARLGGGATVGGVRPYPREGASELTRRHTRRQAMRDHAQPHRVNGPLVDPPPLKPAAPRLLARRLRIVAAFGRCLISAPFTTDGRGAAVQGPRQRAPALPLTGATTLIVARSVADRCRSAGSPPHLNVWRCCI